MVKELWGLGLERHYSLIGKAFWEKPGSTSALQKPRIGKVAWLTLSDVVLKFRNNDNDEKTIELGLEVICKLRIFERRDKNR